MSFLDEAIYERENSIERNLFGSDNEGDGDDKKDGDSKVEEVEAKKIKRRISTQPRLNPEKLMSERGIKVIPDEFKNVKFLGKVGLSLEMEKVAKLQKCFFRVMKLLTWTPS